MYAVVSDLTDDDFSWVTDRCKLMGFTMQGPISAWSLRASDMSVKDLFEAARARHESNKWTEEDKHANIAGNDDSEDEPTTSTKLLGILIQARVRYPSIHSSIFPSLRPTPTHPPTHTSLLARVSARTDSGSRAHMRCLITSSLRCLGGIRGR